jgi:hypothetical protein
MIKVMEMTNWNTTSPFLNNKPFELVANFPFNTVTGLKDDNIREG